MTSTEQKSTGLVLSLSLAIIPVVAASVIGSLATLPAIPGWYALLAKPSFTPPNWLFGPAWTTLYVMMAYAFFRILRQPASDRTRPVAAFMIQIALNAAWSLAFFGRHSPLSGLAVMGPLWLAIAVTAVLFWTRDRLAGALLIPYLAWVSFASALNFEVWRLNP